MTYVPDDVKNLVPTKQGIMARMTRSTHRRIAGVRFTFLIQQLQEEDSDRWTIQAIADAIGCDRSLVSKWHPDNRRHSREPADRSGLTDLVIQGIHDGLGVSSEYLFMSSQGLPNHVLLRDGTKRPCARDEVDHKLFRLEDEELKIRVKQNSRAQQEQAKELTTMRSEIAELRAMLRELVGHYPAKHAK